MGEAKPQQLVWSLSVVEVTEDGGNTAMSGGFDSAHPSDRGGQWSNERTPTQSVRGIVRSAKELHSGLIPFISPQRGGVLNPRHE